MARSIESIFSSIGAGKQYNQYIKHCADNNVSKKQADSTLSKAWDEHCEERYREGSMGKDLLSYFAIGFAFGLLQLPTAGLAISMSKGFMDGLANAHNIEKHGKPFREDVNMGTGIYTTHLYDNINQAINEALDEDSFFGRIGKSMPIDECDQAKVEKVKKTRAAGKLKQELAESGKFETKEELEEAFNMMLIEEAKKAKKKSKKKAKSKDKDSDDDKDDDKKKSKKKDKDNDSSSDTSDDDLDIGDDDSDDKGDKGSSDSDDKKSDKKDSDGKDKDKDKDLDLGEDSIEDKAGKKSSKKKKDKDDDDKDNSDDSDDDKDSKKKAKGKKDKDDDSDSSDSGKDDDLKLEHWGFYSSNYNKRKTNRELVAEEFEILYDKEYEPKMSIPKKKGYLEAAKLRLKPGFEYPAKLPYFERAVNEYFDMTDHNTRKIMVSVDEEDQNVILHTLTDKLYDIIVDKSHTIDYGPIPDTKGDFEALPTYDKLVEAVGIVKGIAEQYRQDLTPFETIDEGINNLVTRKDMFKKCYMSNVQFGIITYQTIAMACVASTSLMIAGAIDFIKNPESGSFQASIDRVGYNKAKNSILFDNLRRFNLICKDKSFDRSLEHVIREQGHNFLGSAVAMSTMGKFAVGALVAVILFNILPILRECTYFFYYTRTRISDWFNLQADLLEISANNIRNGNVETQGDRKSVIKKQEAIRDRFRQIADIFMVESKKAEAETSSAIRDEERKMKADEVLDDVPDSTKSALF